jgi:hypothetical protein
MIVEQKFDDCENHGFQHAWKIFEVNNWRRGEEVLMSNTCSPPPEFPIREDPSPFLRKETTHVRRCQNCTREELFEVSEVRKWVRK